MSLEEGAESLRRAGQVEFTGQNPEESRAVQKEDPRDWQKGLHQESAESSSVYVCEETTRNERKNHPK